MQRGVHRCGPHPSAEIAAELAEARKVNPEGTARLSQQAESPRRQPPQLLFERADAALYTSLASLPQKAGVPVHRLARLVIKELTDNALDATDVAGHPGAVTIHITDDGNLTVEDRGTGIRDATPEQLARIFSVARAMLSAARLDQHRREEAARMSAEERRATALDRQQRREEAAEQRLSDREARQQRQAQLATKKARRIAERKARPTIRDAVLELLPGAIKRAEASGYLFNTRHMLYDIRETVRQRCGATLEQSYFDKLVTEIEAERGDLSPLLLRVLGDCVAIRQEQEAAEDAAEDEGADVSPQVH